MIVFIVLFLERHCQYVLKIIRFGTSHEKSFLMFGVSNIKHLTHLMKTLLALLTSNGRKKILVDICNT